MNGLCREIGHWLVTAKTSRGTIRTRCAQCYLVTHEEEREDDE